MSQVYLLVSSITGLKASTCVTGLFGLVRAQSLGCRPVLVSQVYLSSITGLFVSQLNHWVEGQYLCHRSIWFG